MSPARPRPLRATRAWWGRRRRGTKVLIVGTFGTLLFAFVALVGIGYAAVQVPLPDTVAMPQQVRLTYVDGSTLDTIGQVNRTNVPLSDVPVPVRDAVLAAEDRNFYHEPGVSVRGIGRALLANVVGGGIKQGGSTITQQYAKNAYLGQQRTFTRKIKEVVLAVKLSRKYSKDQLLEFYLNTIYFGRGSYGIEAASQAYFAKPVKQLGPAEGAVLAGLIRAPSYLDPRVNPQAARTRWTEVVDQMVKDKALTGAQRQALAYPTTVKTRGAAGRAKNTGPTSYIDAKVDGFLRNKLGDSTVDLGGLTVSTTVDHTAQAAAEKAVADHTQGAPPDLRVALVSTDPRTGAIKAYYGGQQAGQADAASFLAAPPGSSFKPITLATALEGGTPLTKTYDGSSPQTFNGTPIHNFQLAGVDEQYGQIDLPTATANSVNTVFIALARDAGPSKIVNLAHALGVSDSVQLQAVPEIALGTTDVTPIDMAKVYDTFANRGRQTTPYLVDKVTDRSGQVLYQATPSSNQVLSEKVADDTTYAMQQVLTQGTAKAAQLAGGRSAAGKTGTVTDNVAAWFDGYTPQLSTVVAVSDPKPSGARQKIAPYAACGCSEVTGATAAAPIWQQYMNSALAGAPMLAFAPPATLNQPAPPPTLASQASSSVAAPSSAAPTSSAPAPTVSTSAAPPTTSAPPTTNAPRATSSAPVPITSSVLPPTSSAAPSLTLPPVTSSASPRGTASAGAAPAARSPGG